MLIVLCGGELENISNILSPFFENWGGQTIMILLIGVVDNNNYMKLNTELNQHLSDSIKESQLLILTALKLCL